MSEGSESVWEKVTRFLEERGLSGTPQFVATTSVVAGMVGMVVFSE